MLSYLITLPFLLVALITLIALHPLLALSRLMNTELHYRLIDSGTALLVCGLRILGYRLQIKGLSRLPVKGPFIVIANHQSLYDIPLLMWILRRYKPKFVAKKELARGFPCVSLVLRTGGSALVDRKDRAQALPEIEALGRRIKNDCSVACIFPEGTRARDGIMKPFKPKGLQALLRGAPDTPIVPVLIDGTYRIFLHNLFPIPYGGEILVQVMPAFQAGQDTAPAALNDARALLLSAQALERSARNSRRPAP